LDPETVIKTIALKELEADSNLKAQILNEMKKFKEDQKGLIRLDLSVYGDDKDFSEEGIVRYYYEKLGGRNHARRSMKKPLKDNLQEVF
jgi:hypothetical protein